MVTLEAFYCIVGIYIYLREYIFDSHCEKNDDNMILNYYCIIKDIHIQHNP